MRVIQTYRFNISTKTPYSTYPEIVHRFLEDQKLTSHRFLYYFDEMVFMKTCEETLATGSCAKAVKDCPALGEIRSLNYFEYGMPPGYYLSNIDSDTGCTEADILPHMKSIHRRYGFRESDLYYFDIDFFDHVIPCERDMSKAADFSILHQRDTNPELFLYDQPIGSGIRLHRYLTGRNYISMSIDLLHNGKIHDATPYLNAMKKLLPHIRPAVSMQIYLTEEEKQEIAYWGEQIAPSVEKSKAFFSKHFPTKDRQNIDFSTYTLAPKLKTLAKQYGFSYHYEGDGIYILDKRTARGHVLRLLVDSGPSHFDTSYIVNYQGIGFCHVLCKSMQTPTNQAESDTCSETMLSVLCEFEKTLVPELNTYYAETPAWFVPSAWW